MRNGPYELVVAPDRYPGKRYRGRYAYQHHVVYWQTYGKTPSDGEVIHHINGNKRDNTPLNLSLISVSAHAKEHAQEKSIAASVSAQCGHCGGEFKRTGAVIRWRAKNRKHGKLFCSRSCGAKHQHQLRAS